MNIITQRRYEYNSVNERSLALFDVESLHTRTFSKKGLNKLFSERREFRESLAARRLVTWLNNGPHAYDQESGFLQMNRDFLASIIDANKRARDCNTQSFLDWFQTFNPGFRYINYSNQGHKCRRVTSRGLSYLAYNLEQQWNDEKVYVDTRTLSAPGGRMNPIAR